MSLLHMNVARGPRLVCVNLCTRSCHRVARARAWPGGAAITSAQIPTSASFRRAHFFAFAAPRSQNRRRHSRSGRTPPFSGLSTPAPDDVAKSDAPYYFATGYAGWPKRPSRPFPPPFFTPPSGSLSNPLSKQDGNAGKQPEVDGQMMRGITNGDDAMLASESLIVTNDGVGQWATRERGHAPLWSRLIAHFQALAMEQARIEHKNADPQPVEYLGKAYDQTKVALSSPTEWLGTTTASSAMIHSVADEGGAPKPLLYVTQLGDCAVLVLRMPQLSSSLTTEEAQQPNKDSKAGSPHAASPSSASPPSPAPSDDVSKPQILFATIEQWHYFDCPRQLGTNSFDTPSDNAVVDQIPLQENDIVLTMSDGVTDNLWQHEIAQYVSDALEGWRSEQNEQQENSETEAADRAEATGPDAFTAEAMNFVAQEIVLAARRIAEDPFAASPYMEKAIEEGLAIEGGKLDDISCVAAAVCRRESKKAGG